MPIKIPFIASLLAALAWAFGAAPVGAAPQVLGLVSSAGEVTLYCHGDDCGANLSAFCLQAERRTPAGGAAYLFADPDGVRLTGLSRDGRRVMLDAARELTVTAERDQLAVRVAMPRARLAELGIHRVLFEVRENVTLLPAALAGEDDPLSAGEVALARGPLRRAGSRLVDDDTTGMAAARWLARLLDRLPPDASAEARDRDRLVEAALGSRALADLTESARQLAQGRLDICRVGVDLGAYESLRHCLEFEHDAILRRLNVTFWRAIEGGS